jgi:hypothetical protein
MSARWIAVIGTSIFAFALKYVGASVPAKWLAHPRVGRINLFIPIALLTALVAVNSFAVKSKLVIDHRIFGLGVAIIALLLKAPFPVIVIGAAAGSALAYHFNF